MSAPRLSERSLRLRILTAYYVTLLILLAASFFPEYRVWGVNWWAFFPLSTRLTLFALGAAVPAVAILIERRVQLESGAWSSEGGGSGAYYLIAGLLGLTIAAGFYLLRVKTFFLGDGYTLISYLGKEDPFIKGRGLGEALTHIWVKLLIGGSGEDGALASFRIVSIGAGLLFLTTTVLAGTRIFARRTLALLFFLGMISSGYLLLYFGYAEYYSLFLLSVALVTFLGILIAGGRVNRWWIVLPVALAVFLHIFGVILIPATLYVLVSGSPVGRRLNRIDRKTKTLLIFVATVGAIALFVSYYSTHPFFRFALLPILKNRFTVEGYTLLSPAHLLDYANLLLLLLPGLLVFVATVAQRGFRNRFRQPPMRFLGILTLSALAAAFVFDPKLGMPRDWDLFAFSGIPLAALTYFMVLSRADGSRATRLAVVCAVVLGFLVLWPRVVTLKTPDITLRHLDTYFSLDQKKNRTARKLLVSYYLNLGDSSRAAEEKERWDRDYPERQVFWQAYYLEQQGRIAEATNLYRQVIGMNPSMSDGWSHLGLCLSRQGMYDSAIFCCNVAVGLNPYDQASYNNLGTSLLHEGRYEEAEDALLKAYSLSDTSVVPLYNIATMAKQRNLPEKYEHYLRRAAMHPAAIPQIVMELAEYYILAGRTEEAKDVLAATLGKTIDSTDVQALMEKYPQVKWQSGAP